MGRAIDVDNKLDKQEIRINKLEGAVSEIIDILEAMRQTNSEKIIVNEESKNGKKKKANNKRTS